MSTAVTVAAADVGASSGRVVRADVGNGELRVTEVHRFPNTPVREDGALRWQLPAIEAGIRTGLAACGPVDSLGIDTWAVDHGLLDSDGRLLANPVHYRDPRTDGVVEKVLAAVAATEIYARTGIQFLPINTLYQLVAARDAGELAAAARVLLIPDLLAYRLTGVARTEVTNASTTQLLDVRTRAWSDELIAAVGLDRSLFGQLTVPGERIGAVAGTRVLAVASHDTASAVVGVPAQSERFAFISSGTWSLAGLELPAPVLTPESRRANFTNELGVDGTVRFLRNVMGLWLLQESMRCWRTSDLTGLLAAAARMPALTALVDVDDPMFLAPTDAAPLDMPGRIAAACRALGQPEPADRAATVRCILDSLALAYRWAIHQAQRLSGRDVDVIHVVGGGARNELLCQLTADACGLPVVAGPAEATALGNVLVQARALGAVGGSLDELRALLRHTQDLRRYTPTPGGAASWRTALYRLDRTQ
jgi:rhamnulokinase